MKEQKTQQFAKFYLKDIKLKLQKGSANKNNFDEYRFSSSS